MKIIELLNKIANGEEVPKKIKYDGSIYEYVRMWEQYVHEASETPLLKEISNYNYSGLNNEVEIIEEEKKIPEKITINDNGTIGFPNGEWTARNMDKAFAIKFNQLIDYLESKGE